MSVSDSEPLEIAALPPLADAWFLTGPTAAGKTAVGIELAKRLRAEIVSLDSMAVYRGLDIGTAKPTPEQRAEVPHHLLDVVDPTYDYSLAEYVESVHNEVKQIRGRGREVLFVGGTPLYLKSLLRGLYQGPPPDWEFRQAIEEELARVGIEALRQRLESVDPLSAAKLHPHDKRRMIRALEVYKLTGRPISHLQTQFEAGSSAEKCKVFVLAWPRAELHHRIEQRVDAMFAQGLVDETRQVMERFGSLGRTAAQAVGYREVMEHFAGLRDLPTTIEQVKAATRQFARRQETWFRGLSECRFLPQSEGRSAESIAEEIATTVS